jgi:hypothetical protein
MESVGVWDGRVFLKMMLKLFVGLERIKVESA